MSYKLLLYLLILCREQCLGRIPRILPEPPRHKETEKPTSQILEASFLWFGSAALKILFGTDGVESFGVIFYTIMPTSAQKLLTLACRNFYNRTRHFHTFITSSYREMCTTVLLYCTFWNRGEVIAGFSLRSYWSICTFVLG